MEEKVEINIYHIYIMSVYVAFSPIQKENHCTVMEIMVSKYAQYISHKQNV